MLYALLRAVAGIAVRWYYRAVEVEGLDRIPADGPVILAANHNNALVDALVVATAVSREVRLTAKATLLDNPLTRVVVRAVGVIPLRRASDEARAGGTADASRNQGAFDLVVATLADNGMLLIFPEGKSHSEPELAPLRSGCARMALQGIDAGIPSVSVVPLGLTFEAKGRPRSRVFLHAGMPIRVTAESAHVAEPVDTLTALLEERMRAVTLNFPTSADAERVMSLARQLSRVMDETRPLSNPDTPFADVVATARQLENVRRILPSLPANTHSRTIEIPERLDRLQREAQSLGVPLGELTMATSRRAGAWFLVRELLIAAVCAPIAWWGRLNHWLPLQCALWLGRKTSRNPDDPAMHTLVAGVIIVVFTYVLITFGVSRAFGWGWAALYLASLPAAASLDFWFRDRFRRAVQRARGYLALRRHSERARALIEERDALIREVRSVGSQLADA